MTRFAYYDLHDHQFEELVIQICKRILGTGTKAFSPGPDGGRDGRFAGTAERYPSSASPLVGKVIIQAKHTEEPFAKFSDPAFSGDAETSVFSKEAPRIKALKAAGELDHYLLFSNRRLAGNAEAKLTKSLAELTGVESIHLFGVEDIEGFLKEYAEVAASTAVAESERPLRVTPDDLAEVVCALNDVQADLDVEQVVLHSALERQSYASKCEATGLSADYASLIRRRYLKDFRLVQVFLADPDNEEAAKQYRLAADEFEAKIIEMRATFSKFDALLNYMLEKLLERDIDLRRHKKLTRTVLYYMFWNCDIGNTDAASTN